MKIFRLLFLIIFLGILILLISFTVTAVISNPGSFDLKQPDGLVKGNLTVNTTVIYDSCANDKMTVIDYFCGGQGNNTKLERKFPCFKLGYNYKCIDSKCALPIPPLTLEPEGRI